MQDPPAFITVDIISSNQRFRDTLTMVFEGPAKGLCELSNNHLADAVIIDLDGVGAHAQWESYRNKYPDRPSIVLSVKGGDIPHADETLLKPIKIQEFCATAKRVADRLARQKTGKPEPKTDIIPVFKSTPVAVSVPPPPAAVESEPDTQPVPALAQELERSITQKHVPSPPLPIKDFKEVCGDRENIDIDNPEHVSDILLGLDNHLLGAVLHAISETERLQVPMSLSLKQKTLLVLFPGQQTASFTIKDDMLQRLCIKTFPADALLLKPELALMPDTNDTSGISKEAMLWKMAAWTYCGKLPQNTRLQERIYLRHWPNLTRLLELPDAMRISSLLVDQPMMLVRVAEALGIPQRHVFAYYSAAHTIGLMGYAKRNSDYLIEPPPAPAEHVERKLLGRMMRHLRHLLT